MTNIVRITEENKNDKESNDSVARRSSYVNNIESITEHRIKKASSSVRNKILKAASKINW
ncbi:TPA: hypothetical protein ACOEGY_003795 [Enterobacter bugandensis]|uniref:hypothetical protein n=1 Tax=Enterobacter TaxID=547 RepID=UPI000AF03F51|nr:MULTISPECIES: hypothetical protein [Enterobacter]ELE9733982.1 hypothetical protein [Enterobacter kobei]ELJ5856038.1 hypothetical protein [Enterobacter kobei]MBE4944054.1 hypothetical protein [Enterobacter cloacae complex sp. P1B]MBE4967797.1 hypothetical protein [Enterobacter cloacae complex sp. P11RS]MBT2092215.1 hypothetical protein [Enterobacter bugandensis]